VFVQPSIRSIFPRPLPLLAALLVAFVFGGAAGAAEMTETVLPNGLRVVLRPVDANPVICTAVLVRAGVAWEPEGMSGASHFLEHLLFNGTETRTQEQLYADVDMIGAYNNATTRADHTLYMLLAPGEHLDRALEIQADMLLHSTLPPDKFEKEKGIVLEEMGRDSTDPGHLASGFFTEKLYAGSPYSRPVLGTVDSIRGLTRDDVSAYYHDRYVPERMVLFLAGDFDPDDAMQRIRKYFGAAADESAEVAPDDSLPQVSVPFDTASRMSHQQIEAGRLYLNAAFPAPAEGDPDAAAFGLMIELLGGGSSTLEQTLKGGDAPAVFDYSLSHDTTGGLGTLNFSATLTGESSPEEVIKRAVESIVRTVRGGEIDPVDLRVLREERLTDDATLEEQVHYYAMFRAPRLLQASTSQLADEDARREAVDIDTFERLVDRFLVPTRAVMTVSGPEEKDGAVTTIAFAQDEHGVPATDTDSSTASAGDETVVLPNGLTLSVRTEPGEPVFAVHVIARNRSAMEPDERAGLADLVHHLMLRGTLARDGASLDEEIRGIGARVKFHDNPRFPFDDYRTTTAYSFAIIESRTEHAFAALRLLAEILQTPRFDLSEIDKSVASMKDIAQRKEESSRSVSSRSFSELVAPGHPMSRAVAGTVDSLEGVGRDEIVRMHAKLFDPQNMIVSIRGGGSPEAVLRRAKAIFGGPGPAGGFALIDTMNIKVPTALISPPGVTEEPKRAEQTLGKRQSYLRFGAVLELPESDRAALTVAGLILSDRLAMDLRETQGLAYSIGAGFSQLGEGRGLLSVAMGTAPDNVEKAESEIRRVASELRDGPIEADEVERVVAARVGRILMRRLPSQNQAFYDGLYLLYGVPTGGNLEFLEALRGVGPEEVAAAAKRYIDPDGWVTAIAR